MAAEEAGLTGKGGSGWSGAIKGCDELLASSTESLDLPNLLALWKNQVSRSQAGI